MKISPQNETPVFTHAITRKPGRNCDRGLTTAQLGDPDYELLLLQHQTYLKTLQSAVLEVITLPELPAFPDAYFVEDTAVVIPEIAIITIPGAASRKGEEVEMEAVLAKYRRTVRIKEPGTVDGGDVLQAGSHFFIGVSERTNNEGAHQLGHILNEYQYSWTIVPVQTGLHLKSSVNYLGQNTLALTANYAGRAEFKTYNTIIVAESEEYAANILLLNDRLIMPAGFPETRKKLAALHRDVVELELSEIRKMDGGLTCLSLRF
ncbi:dimethylarginine dimethylaminohydrolase family protein [candidate division CSSED10-310 bacterium]|uniref:Dimethylarginine dimethylaminohydrolase family protein n=1 Tax=candidate division CSSED10-310 bacterium TaxID=2855610 RepID=A0ABV6Z3Z0_UNCC1